MLIVNKVGFVGWAPTHSWLACWVAGHHQGGACGWVVHGHSMDLQLGPCYSEALEMWHRLVWVTQRLLLLSLLHPTTAL